MPEVAQLAPPPSVHRAPRVKIRMRLGLARGVLSVIGAAALWEIAGRTFLNNPLFFAPLSTIIAKMGELWASGCRNRARSHRFLDGGLQHQPPTFPARLPFTAGVYR